MLSRGAVNRKGQTAAPPPARPPMREVFDDYLGALNTVLATVEPVALERIAQRLEAALTDDNVIYAAGNGGSAATASHWVNDLSQAPSRMRVFALCDNASSLTARANDHGVEHMFSAQLAPLLRAGDVLVLVSVSGNSPNLLRAAALADDRDATTIGLLGWDGGRLRTRCWESIVLSAPSGEYGVVESGHAVVCDVLARRLRSTVPPAAPVS